MPSVILKETVVAPAGTVTVDGTGAKAEFEDDIDTTAPPAGAGAFSPTCAETVVIEFAELGRATLLTAIGLTVRTTPCWLIPSEALIETEVELPTAAVVMLKSAEVVPAGTVTVEGSETTGGLELFSDIG